MFAKKGWCQQIKKTCAQALVERGIDIASACKLAGPSRASYYRPERDWRKRDAAVIDAINNELKRSPQAGFGNATDKSVTKVIRSINRAWTANTITS